MCARRIERSLIIVATFAVTGACSPPSDIESDAPEPPSSRVAPALSKDTPEEKSPSPESEAAPIVPPAKAGDTSLTLPIELVDANEFADGGTTYAYLKDANGNELVLCVSQGAFPSTIPGLTLFLGGPFPTHASARLPHSQQEARSAIAALEFAIRGTMPPQWNEKLQKGGVSFAEVFSDYERQNQNGPHSEDYWRRAFAFHAWRLVQDQSEFAVYNPEKSLEPEWYAEFAKEKQQRLADIERQKQADQRFEACYPAEARPLLILENRAGEIQASPGGSGYSQDADLARQGTKLAKAVGDPVRLAEASCKALGTLHESWTISTPRELIAMEAARRVSAAEFVEALPKLQGDDTAMLGAARMFYYLEYWKALSRAEWEQWAPPITAALMNHGDDANKQAAIRTLGRSEYAGAITLLRRIARGEIGVEPDLAEQRDEEPGLRASAYLALAMKGDEAVRKDIKDALAEAAVKQNVVALQVALGLLGDRSYPTEESFELESYTIGLAALRAIEQFEGRHGMDVLMSAGLDHPYAGVANEAMLTAQRLTGEQWVPTGTRSQARNFKDEAKAWWENNGETFRTEHAEE